MAMAMPPTPMSMPVAMPTTPPTVTVGVTVSTPPAVATSTTVPDGTVVVGRGGVALVLAVTAGGWAPAAGPPVTSTPVKRQRDNSRKREEEADEGGAV